ncbi:type II toxin-antitoxin system VapB family antitoxin [Endozoicomonas euniceicola]|uniref:Type II toxin-antitoxin system VapB family antitoxin n=1 Tax=Endozoicomonas euniceicola TaxID=1234143 RepID=A0ABY6GPI7_9GAMM|nr:type II toxin-antitoxin system VapB family antitoxin [Endozoicomonas euniceicola]UYM14663.1 type II toxin-antitoxin system VapB family antitoxin [Endozoicomonas euniceicola]
MRTNIVIDDQLMEEALKASGLSSDCSPPYRVRLLIS